MVLVLGMQELFILDDLLRRVCSGRTIETEKALGSYMERIGGDRFGKREEINFGMFGVK